MLVAGYAVDVILVGMKSLPSSLEYPGSVNFRSDQAFLDSCIYLLRFHSVSQWLTIPFNCDIDYIRRSRSSLPNNIDSSKSVLSSFVDKEEQLSSCNTQLIKTIILVF